MTNKLRAFISSTMQDLGNERRMVAKALQKLGILPVSAETMSPNGDTCWGVIHSELSSSHIFILILGASYGSEPDSGYGAGMGLSITHLELNTARSMRKPILAFMKRLDQRAPKDEKRDKFRTEVSEWSTGVFVQPFDWADELEEKVFNAVTNFWQDHYLRSLVPHEIVPVHQETFSVSAATSASDPAFGLRRILLAGAGMSVAAGYPTAQLLMRMMANDLWNSRVESSELHSLNFSTLAGYYAEKLGNDALRSCIAKALNTPQAVSPTPAHMAAVRCFRFIITTNYDELFEESCRRQNLRYRVIYPHHELRSSNMGEIEIHKLVGSISEPSTMLVTEADLARAAESKNFKQISHLLHANELFVVGHGLRDGNIAALLDKRSSSLDCTYVSPHISDVSEVLLHRYGFKLVRQTADDFMAQLEIKDLNSTRSLN